MVSNVPKKNVFIKLLSLGSSSFQIRKKLQTFFSDKLTSRNLKSFSPSRISYLKCYFQDLFTSISVVAAMLPIMERPNAILKSEFVNIQAFRISLKKSKDWQLTAIQEHLLCCNYSPSFEDFSILTRESNDSKLKIMESQLTARDKTILNKTHSFSPLELF